MLPPNVTVYHKNELFWSYWEKKKKADTRKPLKTEWTLFSYEPFTFIKES